jgi:hypothetical protein
MAKSQESGSESEWNIYIVNEPGRFGGPFGVYVDDCDEALYERIAKPINIFMEIRGKGLIAQVRKGHEDLSRQKYCVVV